MQEPWSLTMKPLALTLSYILFMTGIAYFVLTHPSKDQVRRLEVELGQLRAKNEAVAAENAELELEVIALRDDPRLAERRARESAGLVKPDELVFQFDREQDPQTIAVELRATEDALVLAGEEVSAAALDAKLGELREHVDGAHLTVVFTEDTSALRRQRVRDIVDASALAPAIYRNQ